MECGECTLCCDLFPVKWLNKPANEKCIHCDLGCKIHETKPAECKDFDCAYVQVEGVPIDLRPDKCGVIFEKFSDRIFFGTRVPDRELSEFGKKQVHAFTNQGFSVVLASTKKEEKTFFYLAEGHTEEEIKKEFSDILMEKYGDLRN